MLLCSIAALALVIERFLSLRTARIAPPRLLAEAVTVSLKGAPPPEVIAQLERSSALGQILASGLRLLRSAPRCSGDELRAQMETTGREVAHGLEKYLSALATIASAAPLLGLLGTVIGMIEIFGSQAPGGGAMGGAGNPAQLAHGISIALYNTAFGLMIAIPALIFWRYFRARVDAFLLTLEIASERFARHLSALPRGAQAPTAARDASPAAAAPAMPAVPVATAAEPAPMSLSRDSMRADLQRTGAA